MEGNSTIRRTQKPAQTVVMCFKIGFINSCFLFENLVRVSDSFHESKLTANASMTIANSKEEMLKSMVNFDQFNPSEMREASNDPTIMLRGNVRSSLFMIIDCDVRI